MTRSVFTPLRALATVGASAGGIAAVALLAAQPALAENQADGASETMTEGEERLTKLLEDFRGLRLPWL